MKAKNKKIYKTIGSRQAALSVVAGFIFSFSLFVATITGVSAESRKEKCNALQSPAAVTQCLDNLNVETWNICITRPENERGPCAEEYMNGGAASTSNDLDAPSITSDERDEIANCDAKTDDCLAKNPIVRWVLLIVNFLSAGSGVIITAVIVVGGIQYASAGSNPQAVASAKRRITNALLALLALIFFFSFIQWLVPGGVF